MQFDCTIRYYLCSMKSISFKNFRKFTDFPEFKFGDITILVGGNNAGKSTLQKALLLVLDNLRSLKIKREGNEILSNGFMMPQFRFDANDFHDLNLGTFERSLNRNAPSQIMSFALDIDNFIINITVEPDSMGEELPVAKVSIISIYDQKRHIYYNFNFNARRMRVEFKPIESNGDPQFDVIQKRIGELRESLANEDDPYEAALANEELEKLLKVRNAFVYENVSTNDSVTIEAELNEYLGIKGLNRITSSALAGYIENIEAYTGVMGTLTKKTFHLFEDKSDKTSSEASKESEGKFLFQFSRNGEIKNIAHYDVNKEDKANEQVLSDKSSLIIESARALQRELNATKVYYIQAHGVTQQMLYTIEDKNDFVAQVIHKFARYGIKSGQKPDSFIKKWMLEFGIGKDYEIRSIGGEGYQVIIKSNGKEMDLADFGMGSNQLIVLLFSLATIMFEEGHQDKDGCNSNVPKFIIIEEPEQNLHPRLQSKLADLFLEVAKDPSYKFLIETHSEYLIRRTQVLVAEMNLNKGELESQNPFKVYYFPGDGVPYDMKYLTSGRFENKFGNGFFDESAKWHLEILKKEKEKK